MEAVIQTRTLRPGCDRVLGALRTKNKRLNGAAVDVFCRLGSPAIEFLALEAIETSIRPDHRLRLLNVILQIGGPVRASEYYQFVSLLSNTKVRRSKRRCSKFF